MKTWIPHPLIAALWLCLVPGAARAAEGGLEVWPEPAMLLVLLVVFVVLVIPINQLLFQPIFRVLDQRDERIAGTRRRAEQLETQAEDLLARHASAVAAAREEAEGDRRLRLDEARSAHASITSGARGETEDQIQRARAEISAALEEARVQLRGQSEELGRQAATRVLGRNFS